MFKVKTYNKISEKGLCLFDSNHYQVAEDVKQPDAIVLRSQKLHNEVLPSSVKALARAGAGTNNVPVEQCSEQGIVVFNTPGANANAVKELVLAGLLLSARGILVGNAFVNTLTKIDDSSEMSQLLEKEKKRFAGSELAGKSLGVIGLGAIGAMVADAGLALGMKVCGYDPALSVEAAWKLPSSVQRMESLESLVSRVDYLTLHVPAIPATRSLINAEVLAQIKPGAVLLNFAREAVVDAKAVVSALESGALRRYVCDFPEPCLIGNPGVIALPHLGASTQEAEENCAVMAVNQLRDYLENGNIKNSVNFPETIMARGDKAFRITFANRNVSGVLGKVLGIFADNEVNVIDMVNKSRGELAYNILDLAQMPQDSVIDAIAAVDHVIAMRVIC